MDASILIQGLGLAAVVGVMLWDVRAQEEEGRRGVARAQAASAEQRCPFCHEDFEPEDVSVHCATCGTGHHAECWLTHGGCTILGCHSDAICQEEVPSQAPPEEAPDQQALTEATPCG